MLCPIQFVLLLFCIFCSSFALNISTCGITKNCVFTPNNCEPQSSDCMIFTYAWNSSRRQFDMEMRGGVGGGSEYVGTAFSSSEQMKNSDLYICTGESFKTGTIHTRHLEPTTDETLPANVTNVSAATVDGVAECSFTRGPIVDRNIHGGEVEFNLETTKFYILQAKGEYFSFEVQLMFPHGSSEDDRRATGPYNFIDDGNASTIGTPTTTSDGSASTTGTPTTTSEAHGMTTPGGGGCPRLTLNRLLMLLSFCILLIQTLF